MDSTATVLIARVRSMGIQIVEKRWKVLTNLPLPPELSTELRSHHDEIRDALWAEQSRARQTRADARLAADRAAFIEESKRLGKYRGAGVGDRAT